MSIPVVGTPAASAPEADASARGGSRRVTALDLVLAVVMGLAVLLVHDVPYVLHSPYWLDEAWVADSARAPLSLLPHLTSSSPIGWTFLLHIVPFGGEQRQRIVPVLFAGLAAAAGYLLGRELRLGRFTTGLLTGAALLLSPALLIQGDLKQYTAEAFMSVVVWLCVARAENEPKRRWLAVLAAAGSFGVLLGSTVIFTALAAMGGLGLECLVRRHYRRLGEVAVATAGMLAVFGAFYELLLRSGDNAAMVAYWKPFYIPRDPGRALSYLGMRFHALAPYLGFPWWWLSVVLALAGVVALACLGRIALAALLPVTLLILIVAGLVQVYPFGDIRTSTFWTAMVPVLAAVAIATAAHGLGARWRGRGRGGTRAGAAITAVLAAASLAAYTVASLSGIRSHTINSENVRAPVSYLEAHYRPGDVIIVNYGASYGFAYYYTTPPSSFPADAQVATGFIPSYASYPWIVLMRERDPAAVQRALSQAKAELAREGSRSTGRIWVIRSHMHAAEADAWQQALADGGKVRTYQLSGDPLLLYQPGA